MNLKADVKTWACAIVIKEERRRTKLKQYECAAKAGLTNYRMNGIENARFLPTSLEFDQLVVVFDLDVRSLNQKIEEQCKILLGEKPACFTSECINYFELRNKEDHVL